MCECFISINERYPFQIVLLDYRIAVDIVDFQCRSCNKRFRETDALFFLLAVLCVRIVEYSIAV